MKTIIAIDPGASGGIAVQNEHGQYSMPMPDTEGDIIEELRQYSGGAIAYLEMVGGYTGKGQPGSAMFNFGRSYGFLLGALMALQIRVELVHPTRWQKPLAIGKGKDCASKTEWKNKLKAKAQQLFPTQKVTLATADALLLLDYAVKANFSEIKLSFNSTPRN